MAAYPWPGNIRELASVIGNACMMVDGKFLDVGNLPERIQAQSSSQSPADEAFFSLEEISRRHVMRVLQRVGTNKAQAAEILGVGRATIYQLRSRMKLEKPGESALASASYRFLSEQGLPCNPSDYDESSPYRE